MIQLNTETIKVKENGQWQSLASLSGPKGDTGATGATGPQGPQGIPGVPGYPTIQTGDAGKALIVNSTETAPEWGTIAGGLEIVRTDATINNPATQAELDSFELGKSAIVVDNTLYIYSKKEFYGDWGLGYDVYNWVFTDYKDRVDGMGAVIRTEYHVNNSEFTFSGGQYGTGQIYDTMPIWDWYNTTQPAIGDTAKFGLVNNATVEDGYVNIVPTWEQVKDSLPVLELQSTSGTLTDDEYNTALNGCVIKTGSTFYLPSSVDNLYINYYDPKARLNSYSGALQQEYLQITKSSKAFSTSRALYNIFPNFASSDIGKYLKLKQVGGGVSQYEWADPLPSISAGDSGKVLTVNSTEDGVEWNTAGGGGGLKVIDLTSTSNISTDDMAVLSANPESVVLRKSNDTYYYGYTLSGQWMYYSPRTMGDTTSGFLYNYMITVSSNGGTSLSFNTARLFTAPSASNAGKVLKVSSDGRSIRWQDAVPIAPPTTAGTYTLQVTVDASGNPTYSWI